MTTTALSGTTAWARSLEPPLRRFLRTETASAAVLLAAAIAALVWANVDLGSYERVWNAKLEIRLGRWGIEQSVAEWVNNGLMAFFFFVVGLEARREFDIGELRERRRVALPLLAGLGGMAAAVALYLIVNAGRPSAHGWGVAMSTDTAFALGVLALVGPRFPERLRAFMLTVVVVDDIVALLAIATFYTASLAVGPLLLGAALFAVAPIAQRLGIRSGLICFSFAAAAWVCVYESGVDPLIVGLASGLITFAYPRGRTALEQATDRFRTFREQPTPELARSLRRGVQAALSPNERMQALWHPWTSYAIVPLFALANAGIAIDGSLLSRAFRSPITLGIVLAYLVGKPVGIFGMSWLVTKVSRGRLRPPVGWAAVAGGGTIAGVAFTVSLLIATIAFTGAALEEAKIGILTAAAGASLLTWLVFRATAFLPRPLRARALLGTDEPISDLAVDVDVERDHIRGPLAAPVTLVEYGDFECPYCGRAEPVVRELLTGYGHDVRYVWRHLPLSDVHPNAQLAAEAAEAAARQDRFWEYHDLLLGHQDALQADDLLGYARELDLDTDRFRADLERRSGAPQVAEDVDGADLSGVTGTPTFFVNGRRHYGAYDIDTLTAAVRAAGARASIGR